MYIKLLSRDEIEVTRLLSLDPEIRRDNPED
jgi:hypothetical protein